ncbi:MAG: cyclic nucleotide-binding domain-containing protein [bacterium]|nr:cyclic nucleotide-binding domain-containing protein [bacterium]
MLTIIEKVMVLQNIDDFAEVSTEQLAHLAMISEEVDLSAGQPIYGEGDLSDAMYLVLSGRVRLHRGSRDVAVAEANQAFGTWALFDDEPRVTSATPLEASRVLRIYKEHFIDLLADHVQITQGVLKGMVKRLRGLVGRVRLNNDAGGLG